MAQLSYSLIKYMWISLIFSNPTTTFKFKLTNVPCTLRWVLVKDEPCTDPFMKHSSISDSDCLLYVPKLKKKKKD